MNTIVAPTPAAPVVKASLLPGHLRLSIFADYREVWQGAWSELWRALRDKQEAIATALLAGASGASFPLSYADLDPLNAHHWRPGLPLFSTRPFELRLTTYHTDEVTGSRYTRGEHIQGCNYNRRGPLKITHTKSQASSPLLILDQCFGWGMEMSPAELEAIARAMLAAAADAKARPMGKRSYCQVTRGYDTHPAA